MTSSDHHAHQHDHSCDTAHHHHHHAHGKEAIKPIVILGGLFFLAFLIDLYSKKFGFFAFSAVTLFGLYPAAKKLKQYAKIRYYFSIELLLVMACCGAIAIGQSTEAAAVVILFMIGEALESYSTEKARSGVSALASLLPNETTRIMSDGVRKDISTSDIQKGFLLEIKPGSRFPVDGVIKTGTSYVNESLLTGEALPVLKKQGDTVIAGAICLDGVLCMEATNTKQENTVARIVQMVERAQESKSPTMRTIEKFSMYYTPVVIVLGVLVATLPPLFHMGSWHEWFYKALALLLIGCPCALLISTPSAIACGIATASRLGILIKSAYSMETLGKVTWIAFDKTGTLTTGHLTVTDLVSFGPLSSENILSLAASVEEKSNHPLAKSILNFAKKQNILFAHADQGKTLAGKGSEALVNDDEVCVCSPKHAQEHFGLTADQQTKIENLQSKAKTVCLVVVNQKPMGLIALSDHLKDDAKESIEKLRQLGIKSIVLTGDHKLSAEALTKTLGIDVRSQLLPEDKWSYIKKLGQQELVAMVGDGINDAPALTAAHVGIAMGSGTDVAMDSAQITITRHHVYALVDAIALSKLTLLNMKQNITIAVGLKLIFLAMTLMGATTLWLAILADTGATVLVTLNATRLLRH